MSEYIPTTAEVRDAYSSESSDSKFANRAFDLWLAKYKAKIIAQTEERIIKLLRQEAQHLKQVSESIAMDEYMSQEDSELQWWASVVLNKFADTLIKEENKPFITAKQAEQLTNEMLKE